MKIINKIALLASTFLLSIGACLKAFVIRTYVKIPNPEGLGTPPTKAIVRTSRLVFVYPFSTLGNLMIIIGAIIGVIAVIKAYPYILEKLRGYRQEKLA